MLDIDAMLADAPADVPWERVAAVLARDIRGPEPAQHDLTRFELSELITKWGRSKRESKIEIVNALKAIREGEAFAGVGSRDDMLFRVCATLTEQYPYASPESIAKLLAPSLSVMGLDGPSLDDALEKLGRKKRENRTKIEVDRESRVAIYFRHKRDTPYTQAELESFEAQLEASVKGRWVVQKSKSYYLFAGQLEEDGTCHEGTYHGPFTSDDVVNAARTLLAPAVSAGVTLDVVTEKGARAKTPAELVKEYGVVASNITADLTAGYSYYDPDSYTFVEAPCALRNIQPREHPEIDRWLRLFGGKDYPRLLEWIASVTLLREPSSALYLEGPRNSGKTLLAIGLARLWGKNGPTTFEEVLSGGGGQFNELLLNNPLVFGDEVAPTDFRGRVRTGPIREFIQARQRPLKRKFLPAATVKGCVRLILAANNKEMLSSNEHMTVNDIEALVERFFYINIPPEASAYLRDLKARDTGVIDAWIEKDWIAEHALFLRDTIKVSRKSRLLASGEASELARTLTTSTGIRSALCNWLVAFLLDPSRLSQSKERELIKIHKGRLMVNARIFTEHWDVYKTATSTPPTGRVSQAVAGLATGARVHLRNRAGHEVWYREIDTFNLIAWAEETGFATGATLRTCIEQLEVAESKRTN